MSMQDNNAPVRFQPPGNQRKPSAIVIGLVLALAAIVTITLVLIFSKLAEEQRLLKAIPEAAVKQGTPLAWRELGPAGSRGPLGSYLVIGDFTGNGDDELLVADPVNDVATIYPLAGQATQLPGWTEFQLAYAIAWDYTGDGKDEVVEATEEEIVVFSQRGRVLDRLPYGGLVIETADVEGDGVEELIVIDTESSAVKALGPKGRQVRKYAKYPWYSHFCDWDGDGSEEMICQLSEGHYEVVYLDDRTVQFEGPERCSIVADFRSAVGVPKLIIVERSYDSPGDDLVCILSPASASRIILKLPALPPGQTIPKIGTGFRAYPVDFGQGSGQQIAVLRGGYGFSTSIIICGPGGQLQYYEQLGEQVHGAGVATVGSQQHLAVLTSSRVLVYP